MIPGVANIFQSDAELPLETFIAKYENSLVGQSLVSYCRLSPEIATDEFLISVSNDGKLGFLLTSHTLVLLDHKIKRHHVLALRECTSFTQYFQQQCTVSRVDGSLLHVVVSFPPYESIIKKIDAACKWASSQADAAPKPVTDYDPKRPSGALALLRNTHRACRTIKITGVRNVCQQDAVLPLELFLVKYKTGAFGGALASFQMISWQTADDEFLIALSYDKALLFCLTSYTLVLLDERKRYHLLALREITGVRQSGPRTIEVQLRNGEKLNITLGFKPLNSVIENIANMVQWVSGQSTDGPITAPSYEPERPAGSLALYYASRGALWATSFRVTVLLILMFLIVTRRLFLPGFLAILGVSLAGFLGGWVYGWFKQLGY